MLFVVVQTNNMRYPLYTLLLEDGDGVGQPVATSDYISSVLYAGSFD